MGKQSIQDNKYSTLIQMTFIELDYELFKCEYYDNTNDGNELFRGPIKNTERLLD